MRKAGSALVAISTLTAVLTVMPECAHAQRKPKVSSLSKIVSGSDGRQAFSGNVQSLDMKHSVLNVHSIESDDVEIFPFKKNVRVDSAQGEPLELASLKPGTDVLVYYEQKGDRRTVKQIIVLASPPAAPKPKASPPS
jgi:hypothetical protein